MKGPNHQSTMGKAQLEFRLKSMNEDVKFQYQQLEPPKLLILLKLPVPCPVMVMGQYATAGGIRRYVLTYSKLIGVLDT